MLQAAEAIAREVTAKFEGSRYYVDNGRYCAEGQSRSRVVTVLCRYDSNLHNWSVKTSIEHAPPLLLSARNKLRGEEAAVRRGGVLAIRFGDEAFEKDYLVEAAPEETAKQVIDAEVRRVVAAAGGRAELRIDEGTITVGGGGRAYDAAEVEAGLSLLHLVADRVGAVVASRRASHPSKTQVQEEKAQVAQLRKLQSRFWIRATLVQRLMMVGFLGVMSALAVVLLGSFLKFC